MQIVWQNYCHSPALMFNRIRHHQFWPEAMKNKPNQGRTEQAQTNILTGRFLIGPPGALLTLAASRGFRSNR